MSIDIVLTRCEKAILGYHFAKKRGLRQEQKNWHECLRRKWPSSERSRAMTRLRKLDCINGRIGITLRGVQAYRLARVVWNEGRLPSEESKAFVNQVTIE